MARKRRLPSEPHNPSQMKKPRISCGIGKKEDRKECKSSSHSSFSNPFADDTHIRSRESTESTQPFPDKPHPYTAGFFSDLASTIAQKFPFEAFVKEHNCSIAEVSQALSATIVGPLSDPQFQWQKGSGLSPVEYGKHMIAIWKEHYQGRLETPGTAPRTSGSECPSPTISPTSEKQDSDNGPQSSTPSSQVAFRPSSPASSTHSLRVERQEGTGPLSTSSSTLDDERKSPTPINPPRDKARTRGGNQQSSEASKSDASQRPFPQPRTKSSMSSNPPQQSHNANSPRRGYQPSDWRRKTVPVERQPVYQDCFRNYIPVVPKENISILEALEPYLRQSQGTRPATRKL